MDLNTVGEIGSPPTEGLGFEWREGDAWLGGGTYLFSTRQDHLKRLVDLDQAEWPALTWTGQTLQIGAMCKIRELHDFQPPEGWRGGSLIRTCCRAFLAGPKIWNAATVGGNVCLSLPAGSMTTMAVALEARYVLWSADGSSREVAAIDFVTGNNTNILERGELLRQIDLPVASLNKRYAVGRMSITKLGRSSAFLIGTLGADDELLLTVTAATSHPVQLRFSGLPEAAALRHALAEAIPDSLLFDDTNGTPAHRKHLIHYFAQQIRLELGSEAR
ncbi:MAG: CO/xanthine dehydrogenase FAD-binding subunit [Actinomycetes bacterium]|jgi:CO/xanthine dehydrogenase FAD-binding subunit